MLGLHLQVGAALARAAPSLTLPRTCECGRHSTTPKTTDCMKAEVFYFDGCPHSSVAAQRLNDALRIVGRHEVGVERILIETLELADKVGFIGSPTIRIDGEDPFAQGTEQIGMACRVYATPGGLSGSPTVEQIVKVLT